MKIRPDDANLSDLLRRFNLPLPSGPQRAGAGVGIGGSPATPQAVPQPAGAKGTPAAPAAPGTPAMPANPSANAPRPAAAAPLPPAGPDLGTLLDVAGGFDIAGATREAVAQLTRPAPRNDVRASQGPAPSSNGSAAARPEAEADPESRFVSRVSPQVIARPGLLVPSSAKGEPRAAVLVDARIDARPEAAPAARPEARVEARIDQAAQRPEPQAALAQAEARAATELPRHDLRVRVEAAEIQREMAPPSALSPRAPTLEMATMQHWAAVEVSARTLPRNLRSDVAATPSDPPKNGGIRRSGGASEVDWFGPRMARSNAYALVFTFLGLLALFVMARACSG
jgi:hypothetical protein